MKSGFLQRILIAKLFTYKDGRLLLMDVPCYLWSLNVLVLMHRFLEDEFGQQGRSILFKVMETQCILAAKMTQKRFGFSGLKAIKMQLEQGEMIGGGETELIRADVKKPEFIVKVKSTFAEEYKNTFGLRQHPVDDMILGAYTGLFQEQTGNKKLVCIETQCIATGKPYCEFVIREKGTFDIRKPDIARQLPLRFKHDVSKYLDPLGPPVRRKI